jgi:hypothetical protein
MHPMNPYEIHIHPSMLKVRLNKETSKRLSIWKQQASLLLNGQPPEFRSENQELSKSQICFKLFCLFFCVFVCVTALKLQMSCTVMHMISMPAIFSVMDELHVHPCLAIWTCLNHLTIKCCPSLQCVQKSETYFPRALYSCIELKWWHFCTMLKCFSSVQACESDWISLSG